MDHQLQRQETRYRSNLLDRLALPITRDTFNGVSSKVGDTVAPEAIVRTDRSNGAIRIVIADEETIFRESVRLLLQSNGHFDTVGCCSDARATLEVVWNREPQVLLLGRNLLHEVGPDLLTKVADPNVGIKVILLCHALSAEETISALRLGARGIVLTTGPTESLLECIHTVLQGDYWLGKDSIRDLVHAVCNSEGMSRPVKNRFGLTPRELEIIQVVVEGNSNPEIAANFSLSEQTVKHHLSHIFDKLGVYSRLELALFAVNHGLISE